MKLRLILEAGKHPELTSLYGGDQLRRYRSELDRTMPAYKRKHSMRVGNTLAGLTRNRDVVDAGLFHDYVERGGDIQYAATSLGFSQHTIQLINLMSDENKQDGGSVLGHMKQVLADPQVTPEIRNHLIIIKLADRLDNIQRRIDDGSLDESYLERSRKLVKWLLQQYNGDTEYVGILRGRMNDIGLRIKKKHVGVQRSQGVQESWIRFGVLFTEFVQRYGAVRTRRWGKSDARVS